MVTSYNGWTASERASDIGITSLLVGKVAFPSGVRGGHVATVLRYVAEQFHERVEPLIPGYCWGYAYRKNRNADNLSCHASGTAIDLNAPLHPNGKRGTFTVAQAAEIRKIMREVGVCRWGGDFSNPDEMHVEIHGTAGEVAAAAARLTGTSPVVTTCEVDVSRLPVLEKGASGEDVQTLQALLIARSHDEITVDGEFGAKTAKAVGEFQKWAKLDADQVVGSATWTALLRMRP